MADAFDPVRALLYGRVITAAYTMYLNNLGILHPPQPGDFPEGYQLTAWVQMQDFIFGETPRCFMGSSHKAYKIQIKPYWLSAARRPGLNGGTTSMPPG